MARVSRHRPIGVSRGDSADSGGRTRSGPATAAGPAPAGHGEAEVPALVGQADACAAHPGTITLLRWLSLTSPGVSVRAGAQAVRPAWCGRHWPGPLGPGSGCSRAGASAGSAAGQSGERSIRDIPGGRGSRWRVRRPRFRGAHHRSEGGPAERGQVDVCLPDGRLAWLPCLAARLVCHRPDTAAIRLRPPRDGALPGLRRHRRPHQGRSRQRRTGPRRRGPGRSSATS